MFVRLKIVSITVQQRVSMRSWKTLFSLKQNLRLLFATEMNYFSVFVFCDIWRIHLFITRLGCGDQLLQNIY